MNLNHLIVTKDKYNINEILDIVLSEDDIVMTWHAYNDTALPLIIFQINIIKFNDSFSFPLNMNPGSDLLKISSDIKNIVLSENFAYLAYTTKRETIKDYITQYGRCIIG